MTRCCAAKKCREREKENWWRTAGSNYLLPLNLLLFLWVHSTLSERSLGFYAIRWNVWNLKALDTILLKINSKFHISIPCITFNNVNITIPNDESCNWSYYIFMISADDLRHNINKELQKKIREVASRNGSTDINWTWHEGKYLMRNRTHILLTCYNLFTVHTHTHTNFLWESQACRRNP